MTLSVEELSSIARRYWRPDRAFDFSPENSPEAERFLDLWEQELKRMDQWRALLREWGAALPDFSIGNATATCDACFRGVVYPKTEGGPRTHDWRVVGCVSILAPVYVVYGVRYGQRDDERTQGRALFDALPPEMQAPADIVASKIEVAFGFAALPRDIAETPIPLVVERKEPPQTTLFHALFTSVPERVP